MESDDAAAERFRGCVGAAAVCLIVIGLFILDSPINGLDHRLNVDELLAGIACLFSLKRRRNGLCKVTAVFNQAFTGFFQSAACCSLMTISLAST